VNESARLSPDTLLTLDQVAAMARSDLQQVTDAVRDRKLLAQQKQGQWMATVADVRKWLARR
jgi:hypothetical protein